MKCMNAHKDGVAGGELDGGSAATEWQIEWILAGLNFSPPDSHSEPAHPGAPGWREYNSFLRMLRGRWTPPCTIPRDPKSEREEPR